MGLQEAASLARMMDSEHRSPKLPRYQQALRRDQQSSSVAGNSEEGASSGVYPVLDVEAHISS